MHVAEPIVWTPEGVVMIDQRRLPAELVHITYTDYREVASAIRDMVIRGAPAIGVAAAMGVALGVLRSPARSLAELRAEFPLICSTIAQTRPTAVDLFWALERMKRRFDQAAARGLVGRGFDHVPIVPVHREDVAVGGECEPEWLCEIAIS